MKEDFKKSATSKQDRSLPNNKIASSVFSFRRHVVVNNVIENLIVRVENWRTLSPQALLSNLQEKNIRYVDPKTYRLVDIAKLIGDENMPTFLSVVKQSGYDWMITEAANGVQLGDDPINTRLRLLNHPVSIMLADHTNRMISVLEEAGLQPSLQDVADTQASMLLEDRKQSLISQNAIRWNTFCEAINNWDGISPVPEL